ncbi:MAG: hypothetical protein ACRD0I_02940 [Acidimicrobiales bacterium]
MASMHRARRQPRGQQTDKPSLPHGRLGVVWAIVTGAALVGGRYSTAAWMVVLVTLAAAQGCRSWRHGTDRPRILPAAVTALAVTAAGLAGPWAIGAAVLGGLGLAYVAGILAADRSNRQGLVILGSNLRVWALTAALGIAPGLVGAVILVERTHGLAQACLLLGYMVAYDAAFYLVGSGFARAWEGLVAGFAAVGVLTFGVAAVAKPSQPGYYSWLLGAIAIILIPLGGALGERLVGHRGARAPALRRLDSLLILAPVWALVAPVLLG